MLFRANTRPWYVALLGVLCVLSGCTRGEQAETVMPEVTSTVIINHGGIVVEPERTVRVLTVEQARAINRIGDSRQMALARIGWCESGLDPHAIGQHGERGAWQVIPALWGEVPATLEEQAVQADRIYAEHGDWPWSTKDGCREWS